MTVEAPAALAARTGGIARGGPRPAAVSVRLPRDPGFARDAAHAAQDVLNVPLPQRANTWVAMETGPGDPAGQVIWLGPDEWLVLLPAAPAGAGARWEDTLRSALSPHGGTAVEVSAQRQLVLLSGPRAREVLAKGCSIDVHPRVFGRGSAVQTTLAQAGVVLLGLDDSGTEFGILVRSSYAAYLGDWLADATLEHTRDALLDDDAVLDDALQEEPV